MTEQLIKNFTVKLTTPDCFPGAEWYRAGIDLSDDITEVLPYLNAEFDGSDYNHSAKILLWKKEDKKYAFRPHEIVIAPIENREEAQGLVNTIIHRVNTVWLQRDKIEPKFEGKKPLPNILDICKLLPRTNCQECGFVSCMAFAAALRSDSTQLSLCPYISEEDYLHLVS